MAVILLCPLSKHSAAVLISHGPANYWFSFQRKISFSSSCSRTDSKLWNQTHPYLFFNLFIKVQTQNTAHNFRVRLINPLAEYESFFVFIFGTGHRKTHLDILQDNMYKKIQPYNFQNKMTQ